MAEGTLEKKGRRRLGEYFPCVDCGKPVLRTTAIKQVCADCAKIRKRAAARKAYAKRKESRPVKPYRRPGPRPGTRYNKQEPIMARCPMCRALHPVRMNPPANGTRPWVYCESCRIAANRDRTYSPEYSVRL